MAWFNLSALIAAGYCKLLLVTAVHVTGSIVRALNSESGIYCNMRFHKDRKAAMPGSQVQQGLLGYCLLIISLHNYNPVSLDYVRGEYQIIFVNPGSSGNLYSSGIELNFGLLLKTSSQEYSTSCTRSGGHHVIF